MTLKVIGQSLKGQGHIGLGTLLFNRLLEVVKVHVYAKFHQAKCSGSRVIVLTEHDAENNTPVASADSMQLLYLTTPLMTQTVTCSDSLYIASATIVPTTSTPSMLAVIRSNRGRSFSSRNIDYCS